MILALAALGGAAAAVWLGGRLWQTWEPPLDDFVAYWAAARLCLGGKNPYSPGGLLAIQRPLGWPMNIPNMFWNPPWTLVFLLPFALLPYPYARASWLLLHLVLAFICAHRLHGLFGGEVRGRVIALVVLPLFMPTIALLREGQIATLMLAGVVGFLHFEQRGRELTAGVCAALAAIKPHLLYLFWLVLLARAVTARRWRALAASACVIAAAGIGAMIFVPGVLGLYMRSVAAFPPDYWATPTLGAALRFLLGPEHFWLQFVPPAAGVLWLVLFVLGYGQRWSWTEALPVMVAVCGATSAFGWDADRILFLVNVLQVAVWIQAASLNEGPKIRWVVFVFLMINAGALANRVFLISAFWTFWLGPAWLVWYLWARRALLPTGAERPADAR